MPPPTAWEHSYELCQPPLRHLQAAGFAFDVFTGDWVRALTTGGTLVACPRPVLLDPAAARRLIRRERIDCLELVPALADVLASHLERQGENLGGVRLLAVGSDTVRRRLYRRLCRLVGPGGRVVNSYGLTEATIDSTCWGGALEDLEAEDGPVPIGRPLSGTRTYILDGQGELAPVGVVGELYVGGSGVARGYVGSPRQTAERFVPDPNGDPGSRMYATGDRARWRAEGVLELLGRRDGQLKVRGFRVELAEVEAAIGVLARSSRGGRCRPGGWCRRSATYRLHRQRRGRAVDVESLRALPARQAAAADGSVAISDRRVPAADSFRQGGSSQASGVTAGSGGASRGDHTASRRGRGTDRGDLGRLAAGPADRRDG